MRVATWNVNSVRSRIDRVLGYAEASGVDVLAMQETKCKDEQFPREGFEALGYEVATFGVNQWNGVAIASRVGLEDVVRGFDGQPLWGDPPALEARALLGPFPARPQKDVLAAVDENTRLGFVARRDHVDGGEGQDRGCDRRNDDPGAAAHQRAPDQAKIQIAEGGWSGGGRRRRRGPRR